LNLGTSYGGKKREKRREMSRGKEEINRFKRKGPRPAHRIKYLRHGSTVRRVKRNGRNRLKRYHHQTRCSKNQGTNRIGKRQKNKLVLKPKSAREPWQHVEQKGREFSNEKRERRNGGQTFKGKINRDGMSAVDRNFVSVGGARVWRHYPI